MAVRRGPRVLASSYCLTGSRRHRTTTVTAAMISSFALLIAGLLLLHSARAQFTIGGGFQNDHCDFASFQTRVAGARSHTAGKCCHSRHLNPQHSPVNQPRTRLLEENGCDRTESG